MIRNAPSRTVVVLTCVSVLVAVTATGYLWSRDRPGSSVVVEANQGEVVSPVPGWVGPTATPIGDPPAGVGLRADVVRVGSVVLAVGGSVADTTRAAIDGDQFWIPAPRVGRFDLLQGSWTLAAPLPFSETLAYPAALSDGHEVLMVGTLCRDARSHPLEDLRCKPGNLAAAVYDVATDRWREVEIPEVASSAGRTVVVAPLFLDAGAAHFLFEGNSIWSRSNAGVWEHQADLQDDAFEGCSGADYFAAVQHRERSQDAPDTTLPAPVLDLYRARTGIQHFDIPLGTDGADSFGVSCGESSLIVHTPDLDRSWEFEPASGAGRVLPGVVSDSLTDGGVPHRFYDSATFGSGVMMSSILGGTAVFRDFADDTWSTTSAPSFDSCVSLGDWLLCRGTTALEAVNTPPSQSGFLAWQPSLSPTESK